MTCVIETFGEQSYRLTEIFSFPYLSRFSPTISLPTYARQKYDRPIFRQTQSVIDWLCVVQLVSSASNRGHSISPGERTPKVTLDPIFLRSCLCFFRVQSVPPVSFSFFRFFPLFSSLSSVSRIPICRSAKSRNDTVTRRGTRFLWGEREKSNGSRFFSLCIQPFGINQWSRNAFFDVSLLAACNLGNFART